MFTVLKNIAGCLLTAHIKKKAGTHRTLLSPAPAIGHFSAVLFFSFPYNARFFFLKNLAPPLLLFQEALLHDITFGEMAAALSQYCHLLGLFGDLDLFPSRLASELQILLYT